MFSTLTGHVGRTAAAAFVLATLLHAVSAQKVYSSFIYARTGERTPSLMAVNSSLRLTSYGAHQMYNMGQFFRGRYLGTGTVDTHTLVGLNPVLMSNDQVTILTPDSDFASKSAQAFFQSFYPPNTLANSSGSAAAYDPLSVMANNTYLNWPNGGYQYPLVQTFTSYSPESIWVDGTANCVNGELSRQLYYNSKGYQDDYNHTLPWYRMLATLFEGTNIDTQYWSYGLGFGIWELLDFMYRHNSTIKEYFAPGGPFAGPGLEMFSKFSSDKLWNLYANTTVQGSYPSDNILAIGGKTLAAKIKAQLSTSVQYGSINKLNFISGEFQSMYSLISLLGLPGFNSNFHYVPPFGSAIVFEVFTFDTNPPEIPDPSQLWVRFLFRNASDPTSSDPALQNPPLVAYPIFGHGPSNSDMSWNDFQLRMNEISVSNLLSWCRTCQGGPMFCLPFMRSSSGSSSRKSLAPAVGGVIGALVTLAVAGILVALAFFFGGVRFYRKPKTMGGFKGSAKMASDADLHIPGHAAAVGVTVDNEPRKSHHERVGSWELKSEDAKGADFGVSHQRFASLGSTVVDGRRTSFDEEGMGPGLHSPVTPRESV